MTENPKIKEVEQINDFGFPEITFKCYCDRKITTSISTRRTSLNDDLNKIFLKHDCMPDNADAYIYVLKLFRIDDKEIFYYVGSIGLGSRRGFNLLADRIEKHILDKGDFAGIYNRTTQSYIDRTLEYLIKDVSKLELQKIDDAGFNLIEIYDIEGLNMIADEDKKLFDYRVRNEERKKFLEIAIENNTYNVLGGH